MCVLTKPAAGMSQLGAAAATADLGHLERMRIVEHPDRHPAAIWMADLEASSPLTRRLSTAQYFAFGRRWVRASDQCVVDAGGIVGRHVGDGLVAYFLAETAGSESAAVRTCIASAGALRSVLGDVAARHDIPAAEVSLRFGLHWGATLYMGSILSAGRSEVTALGDEMNEAARIESSAPVVEHSPQSRSSNDSTMLTPRRSESIPARSTTRRSLNSPPPPTRHDATRPRSQSARSTRYRTVEQIDPDVLLAAMIEAVS